MLHAEPSLNLTAAQRELLTTCAGCPPGVIHVSGRLALCGPGKIVVIGAAEVRQLESVGYLARAAGTGAYRLTWKGRTAVGGTGAPAPDAITCPRCGAPVRVSAGRCEGCSAELDVPAIRKALRVAFSDTSDASA